MQRILGLWSKNTVRTNNNSNFSFYNNIYLNLFIKKVKSRGNPPRKRLHLSVEFSYYVLRNFYMKLSRFTDSQMMQILKQAEAGISASELCGEHGMSSATFYKWRAKYGGMDA